MKKLQHIRTRRQLFRITAATAASIPFHLHNFAPSTRPCLLKGTKISTPSGDRLVQELEIGDEVQTTTQGIRSSICLSETSCRSHWLLTPGR